VAARGAATGDMGSDPLFDANGYSPSTASQISFICARS
jgi:hypothetical protein